MGTLLLSVGVFAQERLPTTDGPAVEVVSQKMAVAVNNAKSTLQGVMEGDPAAIQAVFTQYLVPAALALLAMIVGYMVASFVGRIVGTVVTEHVDVTLGKFVGRMVTNVILLLIGLAVLSRCGIETSSFAAILAAAGFAVGMALQGTLSNFAAGVMLLVFRPFKVQDYIKINGAEGTVEEVALFTTRMNTLDNRHLIVPNGQIFGATIENCTHNQRRRVDVNVGVEYQADLRTTRQVLSDAIAMIPGALREPAAQVYLMELGDSSVNWQIRVWCRPSAFWDVKERTISAAKDALDANQISIPFPQMDIHVVANAANVKAA
jgi:small conductance mechanosensitive channel